MKTGIPYWDDYFEWLIGAYRAQKISRCGFVDKMGLWQKGKKEGELKTREAGELSRMMMDGMDGAGTIEFHDRRNRAIFGCMKHLKEQIGYFAFSESQVIRYMEEYGFLRDAGGRRYVRKVLKGYEHPVMGLLGIGHKKGAGKRSRFALWLETAVRRAVHRKGLFFDLGRVGL